MGLELGSESASVNVKKSLDESAVFAFQMDTYLKQCFPGFQAYAEKKSKKPAVIAKSSILLDVKPWDDETDMGTLEKCVRWDTESPYS